MYTAVYLPDDDFSVPHFETEEEAIDYVVMNHLCESCFEEGWGSACAAEWVVVKTEKFYKCETLGDVFDAAGMERIK